MGEAENVGVEVIAAVTRQGGAVGVRDAANWIERIAYEGMSGSGKVNADLVGSAGLDSDGNYGGVGVAL